jgi:hypothetical protein
MKEHFINQKKIKGCEIGVFKGENSESLLKELSISHLYLIDAWIQYNGLDFKPKKFPYRKVKRKFKKDNRVLIIKKFSDEAVSYFSDYYLDFIYIDGNHKYEYVLNDLRNWYPKVKVNGVIAGHDYGNRLGVKTAVKEFCFKLGISYHVELPDFYFIKT